MRTETVARVVLILSLGMMWLCIILLDLLGDLSKDAELYLAVSCFGIATFVRVSRGADS